jgi:hypothetical protein
VRRGLIVILLALAVCATVGASVTQARQQPLVVVVRHGGLCIAGSDCRLVLRITDTTIWDGRRSRPLSPAARRSLVSAIHGLTAAYLRTHPFKGTCPMAYDGQESIYRFRGFTPSIPSCKYDVRGIRAVRLTERLLAG